MFVRLAFAVAAHLETDILLVDEVLAVGDTDFQRKCLGKMQEVAEGGRTVVFVSHNMAAVQRLCNHAFLLDSGHLVRAGRSDDVVAAYLEEAGPDQVGGEATIAPEAHRVGGEDARLLRVALLRPARRPHRPPQLWRATDRRGYVRGEQARGRRDGGGGDL